MRRLTSRHSMPPQSSQRLRRRSPLFLVLLILVWSLILGWGLSQATTNPVGTTDPIPQRLQLGHELYVESCGSCHIALPPAIFPNDTWRRLLQDQQHYGVQINPPRDPGLLLIWNYIQYTSRPLIANEATSYRIGDSRYFRALHPRVELPREVKIDSCITCHPGAPDFNFRRLTPDWDNAP